MSDDLVVDLFAGIGGLSFGFEMAGFKCIAGVEHHPELRRDFSTAHPGAYTGIHDVAGLKGTTLMRAIGIRRGELGVLVGGPPCQPFSMAGKRRGLADDRGHLIDEFVRLVEELRPKAFLMENVVGLLSIHGGRLVARIMRRLREAGYEVCPPQVLNAAQFGVPQVRRRTFIIGLRSKVSFEFPKPTHGVATDLFAIASALAPFVTVNDAISDLPSNGALIDDSQIDDTDKCPYSSAPDNTYQAQMRRQLRRVTGNKVTIHMPHILKAISLESLPFGAEEPKTRYRRLYPDRPAFTLRAGSGSFTALRPIHPYRPRVITVREAARLQSFPDHVEFSPTKRWAYREIGNSVPPILARVLAERLREFIS